MDEDETLEVIKAYYFLSIRHGKEKWSAICGNPTSNDQVQRPIGEPCEDDAVER